MKRKSKRTFLQWLKHLFFFREYKRKERERRRQIAREKFEIFRY